MIFNCPLKVGDLVVDADVYKAPELYRGHGIIVHIINDNYVMVEWLLTGYVEAVDIGYLEFVN